MKTEKLTTKLLENLTPDAILYAEFAEGGAMGAAGTARLYTLEDGKLHFYLVSLDSKHTEADVHAYANAYTFFRELTEKKLLIRADGGFGNNAWKCSGLTFTRDDDNCAFLYRVDDQVYSLESSVPGVYFHIAPTFAERLVTVKALTKFRKKILKKSSPAELAFYDAYLEQAERTDRGISYFDITVDTYWSAIEYIRFLNLELFNLSDSSIASGIAAIQKYRLKFLVEKYGWHTVDQFFCDLITLKSTDVFFELDKYISLIENPTPDNSYIAFKMDRLFSTITYSSSGHSSLDPADPHDITYLFDYPVIVKFTESAHNDILHQIIKSTPSELRANATAISYYLADFIFNEDTLSYADLLPAVTHIIEQLPSDDSNGTDTAHLFWLASEVIDRIWRYASENKTTQKKCRNLIYDLFSPRIGGLWPIAHYDEFRFIHPSADLIFRESLSFLMSLDDIAERNESLKAYLSLYSEGFEYPLDSITCRAFYESLKNLQPPEAFEKILSTIPPEEYSSYFAHPSTQKEAARLLAELFRTDEGARITGLNRISTIEQLLLNGNSIGIGVFIVNFLVQNFDTFSAIVTADSETANLDPLEVITSLYTAAASGATEENEIPPLKALTKKISKYVVDLQIKQTMNAGSLKGQDIRSSEIDVESITEAALRYARKHRRTILFQRSALQKVF